MSLVGRYKWDGGGVFGPGSRGLRELSAGRVLVVCKNGRRRDCSAAQAPNISSGREILR
jgi:hypothetical protein